MSNSVDILVLDGPHAGRMLCQPRPVPATITHENVEYTTAVYGGSYHVAYQDDAALDDAAYWIGLRNMQPSWDLRT